MLSGAAGFTLDAVFLAAIPEPLQCQGCWGGGAGGHGELGGLQGIAAPSPCWDATGLMGQVFLGLTGQARLLLVLNLEAAQTRGSRALPKMRFSSKHSSLYSHFPALCWEWSTHPSPSFTLMFSWVTAAQSAKTNCSPWWTLCLSQPGSSWLRVPFSPCPLSQPHFGGMIRLLHGCRRCSGAAGDHRAQQLLQVRLQLPGTHGNT